METIPNGTEIITTTGARADVLESVGGTDYIVLTKESPRRRVAVNMKECHIPSMPWWPNEKPEEPKPVQPLEQLKIRGEDDRPINDTTDGARPTGIPPRPDIVTKPMQPSTPENPPKPPKGESDNTITPHSIDPPSDPTVPVVEGETFVPATSDSNNSNDTDRPEVREG